MTKVVPTIPPYLDSPAPLAFAHRGGATYAPNQGLENSLAAFRNAAELGYRYLETDVHLSRDGIVYAFHDEVLERVTDGAGAIADLDSTAIARARIDGREPIPRLDELLTALPGCRFNIDIKSDAALEPTLQVLREQDALARVCLASFSGRRLRRVRALEPSVATSCGPAEVAALRLGPLAWLRAYGVRSGGCCVQVPHRHRSITIVNEAFVRHAHDAGLQVHVWTINDPAEMTHLLDLGVDGIVTDRIDTLRSVLESRDSWHRLS